MSDLTSLLSSLGFAAAIAWGWVRTHRTIQTRFGHLGKYSHLGGAICGITTGLAFILAFVGLHVSGVEGGTPLLDTKRILPIALGFGWLYAFWRFSQPRPKASSKIVQQPVPVVTPQPAKTHQELLASLAQHKSAVVSAITGIPPERLSAASKTPTPLPSSGPVTLPSAFSFDYADADGVIKHREVLVQSVRRSALRREYLEGICLQAHAKRSFRLDRVMGTMVRTDDDTPFSAEQVFKAKAKPTAIDTHPANFKKNAAAPKAHWETAVFFAGFSAAKRRELEELADLAGWQVRQSLTKTVTYCVQGSMAGDAQLNKARELDIDVIDEDAFRSLV